MISARHWAHWFTETLVTNASSFRFYGVTQFALQVDLVVFRLITASLANPNGEAGADPGRSGDDAADATRHCCRDGNTATGPFPPAVMRWRPEAENQS